MKKRVFKIAMSVVVLAVIAGVWLQNRKEETKLSDLAMTNIEALAADEIPFKCPPNEKIGYFMTVSTETRTTFGEKLCESPSYGCNCGCRVYFSVEDCPCEETTTSVVVHRSTCRPTDGNACCDFSEEGETIINLDEYL